MASASDAIGAYHLFGEYCTLKEVHGVKKLMSSNKVDIVAVVEGFHDSLLRLTQTVSNLSERVANLEQKSGNGKATTVATAVAPELTGRIAKLEESVQTFQDKLEAGDLKGERGFAGAPGKNGASKLADLKDIDFNGLTEGSILVYRQGNWAVEITE